MEQKVCLDTDVIIYYLNNTHTETIKRMIEEEIHLCVSAISAFELRLRSNNLETVENFLSTVSILDFDSDSSKIAAQTQKELKERGNPLDFRDLFIAASCIANNCALFTNNKKHFQRIHGLELV